MLAKVMVVDDRPEMRQLVAEILQPYAIEVCGCDDGDEALKLYATERPQWVVMDVKMRRVDGLTATRELLRQYPEARVIVISGHDPKAMRQASLEAGARHFLSKEDLGRLPSLVL